MLYVADEYKEAAGAWSISNTRITKLNEHRDGITALGGVHVITNKVIDFCDTPVDEMDEAFSVVENANVAAVNTIIKNVGKAVLVGNENGRAQLSMNLCILENFGRRGVEAQNGSLVVMHNCLIKNWGARDRFSARSFAAWAHHGGRIEMYNCMFHQDTFFNGAFWRDLIGHIGQAWNDRSTRLRDYLLPGVCRGLTAGKGGSTLSVACTKNKWWIVIKTETRS